MTDGGIVKVERFDGLVHTYNPVYLRVVNKERSVHVISNKFYNLKTKEVKEIFTFDKTKKIFI